MNIFDNLLIERDQLNGRLTALSDLMASPSFMKLDSIQRNLLINQHYHMSEYLKILDNRIKDLKLKGLDR